MAKRPKRLKYYTCCYCGTCGNNKYYQGYKSFCNEDCWNKYNKYTLTPKPFLIRCFLCDKEYNIAYHVSISSSHYKNGIKACQTCFDKIPAYGNRQSNYYHIINTVKYAVYRHTPRVQKPIGFDCQGCKKRKVLETYIEVKKQKKKWKVCDEICANIHIISKMGD